LSEAILVQNIAQTASTIPNTDTVFYSNNIKSTVYNNIRVEATLSLATTASTTLQSINIKLKLNGGTLFTWVVRPPVAAISITPYEFTYVGNATQAGGLSQGGILSLTVGAAAADANTNVTGLSIYVTSVDT
jgi:hypothetical protein